MGRKTKKNKITSSEKTALINKNNIRLKDDFLIYLASIQRSPKTIAGYDNDLLIIFTYILENLGNKDFNKLSKRDIASIQNWLINNNGNSPARVRRLKSAMSSLSNYIEQMLDDEDEYKDFRPIIRKVENPALQPVRQKTVWDDDELDVLLDKLVEKQKYEQACMLALAMCSGRRKAELCLFKVDYFKDTNLVCNGALYKTSEQVRTKGAGLGKYLYCYTLAKKFKPYLDLWIKDRENRMIDSEWLFPMKSKPDEHIQESTLNSWAITFSNMTGRDFYWHSLRHYQVSGLAKAGLPDSVIQRIQGWSDISMVSVYKDIEAEDEINMYFDENGDISSKNKKGLSDL